MEKIYGIVQETYFFISLQDIYCEIMSVIQEIN